MIKDLDRSGYFGASDSAKVMAKNRASKTWRNWWLEKLGLRKNTYASKAMRAGTAWEHKILDAVDPAIRKDHQIILERHLLRVNYDGDLDGAIYEVKTHNSLKGFSVTKPYWMQAQVEMYAMGTKELCIVSYGLVPEEYDNYFLPVDAKRMGFHPVERDETWIRNEYLPRLEELCRALRKGRMPT